MTQGTRKMGQGGPGGVGEKPGLLWALRIAGQTHEIAESPGSFHGSQGLPLQPRYPYGGPALSIIACGRDVTCGDVPRGKWLEPHSTHTLT